MYLDPKEKKEVKVEEDTDTVQIPVLDDAPDEEFEVE